VTEGENIQTGGLIASHTVLDPGVASPEHEFQLETRIHPPISTTMLAIKDLDESLRSMYFAPVPLVVLSSVRTIKMFNYSAEKILGVENARCVGLRLERFVAASSRAAFILALKEATESTATSERGVPISTRLELLNPGTISTSFWADLSISAWYSADPSSSQPQSPGATLFAQPAALAPHEALYTISILPSSTPTTTSLNDTDSPRGSQSMASKLKEAAFDRVELGIIALSKDGKTEVRNKAFDNILSIFPNFTLLAPSIEENAADVLPAVEETITVWEGDFERPMASLEWPIFQCAFKGTSSPLVKLGLESKATGERVHIELFSKAIRDNSGYGEHIGGVCTIRDVSAEFQKRKLEAELQGDLHFKHTVDSMPQLAWSASGSGYIEWYNKTYLDYTGLSLSDLQGAGWQDIIPEYQLEDIGKAWSSAIRNDAEFVQAMLLKKHTGEYRWFLSRATPMMEPESGKVLKWFGACTDIHDQVEALSASQRTQLQLQSVVNHAAVTLWAVDQEGIITVAEGPGIRQLHISPDDGDAANLTVPHGEQRDQRGNLMRSTSNTSTERGGRDSVIGRSIFSIWDMSMVRDSVNKALQGETVVAEFEVREKWYRNSYTPLRAQGKEFFTLYGITKLKIDRADVDEGSIVGVVIASMDITDRKEAQKQMEESLLEKTRALAAEGAAREASRLKSEFLANMSHEIRTPIAGIIGLTELWLDEEGVASSQKEYAETIQRSAEGLLTVINDVLDFSKVETGKLEVEQVPFNLVFLLRDLKRMLSFATQRKNLELNDVLNFHYTDNVVGDVGRLRQVLMNLITNAIKFTTHGSVTFEVTELFSDESNVLI
jgi:PAS domain S-box-containing protein